MSNLTKRIEKWLKNPSKYISSKSNERRLINDDQDLLIRLESLTCIRKNEKSKDEIVVLGFWLVENQGSIAVEGIIHLGNDFESEGEEFKLGLGIPLRPIGDNSTFCLMVYEEDAPILLDPHDPIGLVTYQPNGTVSVYKGDFRKVESPLNYSHTSSLSTEVELDADNKGCYLLKYNATITNNEN